MSDIPVLIIREGGLPLDKVVAITDQECDALLGTYYSGDKPRYPFHSSGRLNWACQLKAGDEVQVKMDDSESTLLQ